MLKNIVEKIETDENLRRLINRNFFLSSIFVMFEKLPIEEYHLLFYNPDNKKIVDCSLRDGKIKICEETEATKEFQKLDLSDVKIELERALDIAENEFHKKIGETITNHLASLHKKEFSHQFLTVWTINIIYSGMTAQSYDIDAETGKILHEETTNLVTVK